MTMNGERPKIGEIDAWGLTHMGRSRRENQDYFFVGFLGTGLTVDATGVTDDERRALEGEARLASVGIVADGVGSTAGGGEAARTAVTDLQTAVSMFFQGADPAVLEDPEVISRHMEDAALACHEKLLAKAEEEGNGRRYATTLTLYLGFWPVAYLLQVGDSRCYVYGGDGVLTQVSRDQTVAQDLVDRGALTQTAADATRWADILSSAIGGNELAPVVNRVSPDRGAVILLCSDGLTKHVSDDRIAERLGAMASARQVAEQLLEDALDGGGTDNITIIVMRYAPGDEGGDTHATTGRET